MAHNAIFIYQEGRAQSNVVGMADAICVHDVSSYIRHKGDPNRPNAAPIDGRVAPSVMGELRIDGNANDFNIAFAELFGAVRVSDNFRGTDKGKVQWIKE